MGSARRQTWAQIAPSPLTWGASCNKLPGVPKPVSVSSSVERYVSGVVRFQWASKAFVSVLAHDRSLVKVDTVLTRLGSCQVSNPWDVCSYPPCWAAHTFPNYLGGSLLYPRAVTLCHDSKALGPTWLFKFWISFCLASMFLSSTWNFCEISLSLCLEVVVSVSFWLRLATSFCRLAITASLYLESSSKSERRLTSFPSRRIISSWVEARQDVY